MGDFGRLYPNQSRKPLTDKIVILDVDETLVHTYQNFNKWMELKIMTDPKKIDLRSRCYVINLENDKSIGYQEHMWGVKRPHLEEFLKFCFNYFKYVIVWSAGTYDYVHSIVDDIFKDTYRPHAILTRVDCAGPLNNLEKPFWKLISIVPELKQYLRTEGLESDNIKNMFIIDDRLRSFNRNPNNGILIPVYEPDTTVDGIRKDDLALPQIMNWLMRPDIMQVDDVRRLNKGNIFQTTSVSPGIPLSLNSGITVNNEMKNDIKHKNITSNKRGLILVNS